MFNLEEGKVNFESVEEVKEFLQSTNDNSVLGAICFTDRDGGVEHEIPIADLIEQMGIDAVAEALFRMSEGSELVPVSKEEMEEIFAKLENGEELTEEELRKYRIVDAAANGSFNKIDQRKESLFNGITMTLNMSDDIPLFSTVGGIIALLGTYLECALITSDEKLERAFTNLITAENIAKTAASKIHIDEDASPEIIVLGLLHKLGEYATSSKEIAMKPLNVEGIVDAFDLDSNWIFHPEDKISDTLDHMEELLDQINDITGHSDDSEEKENGSNKAPSNVVDIRERLRRK